MSLVEITKEQVYALPENHTFLVVVPNTYAIEQGVDMVYEARRAGSSIRVLEDVWGWVPLPNCEPLQDIRESELYYYMWESA